MHFFSFSTFFNEKDDPLHSYVYRKQDLQRRKEYKQEIKEMQERVKGRPLLLEQVAQVIV